MEQVTQRIMGLHPHGFELQVGKVGAGLIQL